MTFAEITAEISRRLAEVNNGRVFWSLADIKAAANLGYAELSDATEWNEAWLDIDLLNDRPYYDLRDIIGPAFLAIRLGFDRQTNRWTIPTAPAHLDANDRRWEYSTGEPQRFYLHGLWFLAFFPSIRADLGQVKQYYTALPDPLVNDEDEPGFPDVFQDGIIEFALTDLWAQDGETTLALESWKAYEATEAALGQWVEERAGGPMFHGFGGRPA